MGDETWASIQLVKSKRESFREKLKRRKAERDTILSVASGSNSNSPASSPATSAFSLPPLGTSSATAASATLSAVGSKSGGSTSQIVSSASTKLQTSTGPESSSHPVLNAELERCLLEVLSDCVPPVHADQLLCNPRLKPLLSKQPNNGRVGADGAATVLSNLLQKFSYKELISVSDGGTTITSVQHNRLTAALDSHSSLINVGAGSPPGGSHSSATGTTNTPTTTSAATSSADGKVTGGVDGAKQSQEGSEDGVKGEQEGPACGVPPTKKMKTTASPAIEKDEVMSLLSAPSIRERETKRVEAEILELLNKPTAKERSVVQHFRSQGGKVWQFCPRSTVEECTKWRMAAGRGGVWSCDKLHFRKIIQPHTDETLGDCSFLNTCFHMDTCRYVHYEVDYSGAEEQQASESNNSASAASQSSGPLHTAASSTNGSGSTKAGLLSPRRSHDRTVLFPPQWIQCDLRFLDMAVLGKFSVIMADPPWDIHMELPYGTMSDDEMRQLNIPALQDEGLIFLWVTGRAMELGRECLTLWGYERVDEIIWVKTNQLQRIIRTGRTGHWLNHGKEHCLVGMKGKPKINRCMDCDVIVAEVRATSHKPDEIYGIIERLSPGTRKIELFGRHHNVQPNWLTLGNQLEGVNLLEDDLILKFKEHQQVLSGDCCHEDTSSGSGCS